MVRCQIARNFRKRTGISTEVLVRALTWPDDGLGCEAGEKHRQALLRGLGASGESEIVGSATVEKEEIDPKEDAELLEARSATMVRSWAATLLERGSRAQYAAEEMCIKMARLSR